MGRIVNIVKTLYGKVDWTEVRDKLLKLVKIVVTIKENNAKVKFDKKFIKEFSASKYTQSANRKVKNIKANLVDNIVELVENSGHISIEVNNKNKHKTDSGYRWEKYKCLFRFNSLDERGNNISILYSCCIVIRCPNFNEKYIYDIVDIKKETNQSQR